MLTAAEIALALGGRRAGQNTFTAKCPAHEDRSPSLSLTDTGDGLTLWHCHAGCTQADVRDALVARGLWEAQERTTPKPKAKPPAKPSADNGSKARWLWQRSRLIQGTIAEVYLRCERVLSCPLPATLRFLPGNDRYPPSMIAAFGRPSEPEPGMLAIDGQNVTAVHLTKLTANGCKHPDDPNKIMIGSAPGVPIMLASMNDLLGLAITEGIEDALSVRQATGLGVWAAGSAGRMPALAGTVPDYADSVTIFADANQAGESNSARLAERLKVRGIHAEVLPLAEAPR
jgi:hypothetical protein